MMILVIGGSGSGKSAFAERLTLELAGSMPRFYVATMRAQDEESRQRVRRHRRFRRDGGFVTVEQPVHVGEAAQRMGAGKKCILLECLSNLAANEMFGGGRSPETAYDDMMDGVRLLREQAEHLVVVSNNVFEDGGGYDEAVTDYLRLLGRVNRELARMADRVTEVVAGIPLTIKGSKAGEGDGCVF